MASDRLTDAQLDELEARAKAAEWHGSVWAESYITSSITIQRLIAEVREARKGDHNV